MNAPATSPTFRILVIDDTPAIHEDFRKILAHEEFDAALDAPEAALFGMPRIGRKTVSFTFECALQGQEGFAMVRDALAGGNPYALAFVDMRMPPGWDGIETIRHLWQVDPALQVVICTAYSSYSWSETILHLGASDNFIILKKPFDNIEILQLAHALTRKWQLARENSARLASLDELVRVRTHETQQALALFEASIAQSPLGILIADAPDGTIRLANAAVLGIRGPSDQPLTGIEVSQHASRWQMFRPDGSPYPSRELPLSRAILRSETTRNEELIIRNTQGEDRWVSVNAAPIRDPAGAVIAGIGIFHDITERKQAEAALHSLLAEKEALLKEVHHRVKNNLQVISSLLRLEAGRGTQPDTKSVLKEMQGRIQAMAQLHESLYRSGTFAAVDLGAYLNQLTMRAFRAQVASPGAIRLQLDLTSVQVEMDQALTCGLLVNELISNCLKHGFPDGRTGEVRVELQPIDGGPQVRLRVSDTGAGLPADFEAKRGYSLGLQLISDLATQIGGRLEVGPEPGAVFEVIFTPERTKRKTASDGAKPA